MYKLIILFIILILILILNKKEYFSNSNISFELYNIKKNKINNTQWEHSEQKTLGKYLKKEDNVLQLGGNIGASCIYVDKIINKGNTNICVEPNPKIIDTLKRNRQYNNSRFDIIYGIISEKQNLKLSNKGQNKDKNYWGSKVIKDGDINITSYPLNKIKNINKINILFADCEGCLETFIDEYEYFLNQLRLIIYEADQTNICNYKKIENILKKNNFKKIEVIGQNYVWEKI
jgi:FkbM family methyltransferase